MRSRKELVVGKIRHDMIMIKHDHYELGELITQNWEFHSELGVSRFKPYWYTCSGFGTPEHYEDSSDFQVKSELWMSESTSSPMAESWLRCS